MRQIGFEIKLAVIIVLSFASDSICQAPVRILCLGNSITEGWTDGSLTEDQMKSYRYGLKYLLQNAGYNVDFVGSQESGCLYFSDCQQSKTSQLGLGEVAAALRES